MYAPIQRKALVRTLPTVVCGAVLSWSMAGCVQEQIEQAVQSVVAESQVADGDGAPSNTDDGATFVLSTVNTVSNPSNAPTSTPTPSGEPSAPASNGSGTSGEPDPEPEPPGDGSAPGGNTSSEPPAGGAGNPTPPPPPKPPGDNGTPLPPPSVPTLAISNGLLDFGTTHTSLTFGIKNSGPGTLGYLVETTFGVISISPDQGDSAGEEDVITVTLQRNWLVDWTIVYQGTITVTCDNGDIGTVTVRAQAPVPQYNLQVSHSAVDLGTQLHQASLVLNSSLDGVNFAISANQPWVTLSQSTGAIPSPGGVTIYITVDRCYEEWTTGHYNAIVTLWPLAKPAIQIPLHVEVPAAPSDSVIAGWLAPLPPLQKVHFSYPAPPRLFETSQSGLLYQWARIAHVVPMSAAYGSQAWASKAVEICKQVNAANPSIPCTIAINYSPYHKYLDYGIPPTYNGPEVALEISEFQQKLAALKSWIDAANIAQQTNVQVSGILLNTELWKAKDMSDPNNAAWNAACTAKYDAAWAVCKSVYPTAGVHWYNRAKPIDRGGYFTNQEQGDSFSIECYSTHDLPFLKFKWGLGWARAQAAGSSNLWPWINFNGAFSSTLADGKYRYLCDFDHTQQNAWQLGYELNNAAYVPPQSETIPLKLAPGVVYYSAPFEERFPQMGEHFVAYVKGAAGIPLP